VSVYDDTRPRIEHLCTLIDTPLLPEGGYARLELARNAVQDSDGHVYWHNLSSGEQALLRIAANILSTTDQVSMIDERLRHAVGQLLIELGARLAAESFLDDSYNAESDLAFDRQYAADLGVGLADDDGGPF
jgi:hypothetical protein